MKSVIALLLGLFTILSVATETDEESAASLVDFSSDSADSAGQSYGGLKFRVYQTSEDALTVVLSAEKAEKKDKLKRVYCMNFGTIFEATDYDTVCREDCTYTVVDYTTVNLNDANCVVTNAEDGLNFNVICNSIPVLADDGAGTDNGDKAVLTLAFTFGENESGDYGLVYTITLEDYVMKSGSTSFVMEQTLTDCSDEYPSVSGESDSDSESAADTRRIRRLLTEEDSADTEEGDSEDSADSNSEEESDGVSSDDSDELDVGAAQFMLSGAANDDCTATDADSTPVVVEYFMAWQTETSAVQVVFAPFGCTLKVDPTITIDSSRLYDGSANVVERIMGFVFMAFVAVFLL